jgi:hypothetical protein
LQGGHGEEDYCATIPIYGCENTTFNVVTHDDDEVFRNGVFTTIVNT